jgi:hypothetical protein
MEKEVPGGANSQTFAEESPLDDCGTRLVAARSPTGNLRRIRTATIKTSNAKFRHENIF